MEASATNCPFALNSEGVKFANDCNSYENAYICFSRALEECRKILVHLEERRRGPSFAAGPPFSSLKFLSIQQTAPIEPNGSIESCFIYDRLLLVPRAEDEESSSSSALHAEYVQLSFVILFNLAVTMQMLAKHKESPARAANLEKALRLYGMAYTVQSHGYFQVPASCLMALMNNIGQVHKALGDDENARQWFEHLLALCMLFLVTGQAGMSELEGFFSSATQVILKDSSTAPAA